MSQMEECVLDIPLYDGEKVLFVEERNVQRGRVIHSIIAILFAVAGIFGVKTVIVPVVALVVIVLFVIVVILFAFFGVHFAVAVKFCVPFEMFFAIVVMIYVVEIMMFYFLYMF